MARSLKYSFATRIRGIFIGCMVLIALLLEGCYYMQAIGGQMELMRKRRPVADVINDETTSDVLRVRLRLVQEAREFAVEKLLLPDNGSYRSYADLQRDYVVWNVFAAPEFSLQPKQWCYPVAGCVAYRGYFSLEKASKKASRLEQSGLEVFVGGVAAYSTLGRFDDPLLNTMMRWTDLSLVETLFHELAHQKLYVKGDTAFNESFATAVAEFGLEHWAVMTRALAGLEKMKHLKALQEVLRQLLVESRQDLESVYASGLDDAAKREQKAAILGDLSQAAEQEIDISGVAVGNWLAAPLNNARLVSLGVYQNNLAAFRTILSVCNNNLACFYAESGELAKLAFTERQARLAELNRL